MIKIETNCQDLPKISGLNRFLNLDQDFWDWKVVSRQNQDFLISIKTSWSSRKAFWNCQDFIDRWDLLFASVKIKSLDWDQVKTNQDLQAYLLGLLPIIPLMNVIIQYNWNSLIVHSCRQHWFCQRKPRQKSTKNRVNIVFYCRLCFG